MSYHALVAYMPTVDYSNTITILVFFLDVDAFDGKIVLKVHTSRQHICNVYYQKSLYFKESVRLVTFKKKQPGNFQNKLYFYYNYNTIGATCIILFDSSNLNLPLQCTICAS